MLEKKIQQFIKEFKLFSNKDKLILAISGGVDSVVMLDLMTKIHGNNCVIAHIDHSIRKDTDKDAEVIKKLSEKYKIKYYIEKVDVIKFCRENKVGIEEGARKLRYEKLIKIFNIENADFILTAHNMDDLAENFLMRTIRGTGLNGLPGMRPKNNIYIKPLLSLSKNEIVQYACRKKLEWREDYTNADLKYTRNFIRHKVIPLLKKENPKFLEAIFRLSKILWMEREYIEKELKKIPLKKDSYGISINTNILKKLPEYLKYEVIRKVIEEIQGNVYGFSFENTEEIAKLIDSKSGTLYKKQDLIIQKEYDYIFFSNKNHRKEEHYFEIFSYGKFRYKNLIIEVKKIGNTNNIPQFPLVLRNAKYSDKIRIKNGHKKIKKLIQDKKIPQHLRNKILIVINANNDIIFVNEFENNVKMFESKNFIINIKKECEAVEQRSKKICD